MKTKSYSYLNTNTVLKKNVKSTYFNTNYDEYLFTLRRKGLYINNSRTPVVYALKKTLQINNLRHIITLNTSKIV